MLLHWTVGSLGGGKVKNLNVCRIFSYSLELFIDFSCQRGPSRVMICKAFMQIWF